MIPLNDAVPAFDTVESPVKKGVQAAQHDVDSHQKNQANGQADNSLFHFYLSFLPGAVLAIFVAPRKWAAFALAPITGDRTVPAYQGHQPGNHSGQGKRPGQRLDNNHSSTSGKIIC